MGSLLYYMVYGLFFLGGFYSYFGFTNSCSNLIGVGIVVLFQGTCYSSIRESERVDGDYI